MGQFRSYQETGIQSSSNHILYAIIKTEFTPPYNFLLIACLLLAFVVAGCDSQIAEPEEIVNNQSPDSFFPAKGSSALPGAEGIGNSFKTGVTNTTSSSSDTTTFDIIKSYLDSQTTFSYAAIAGIYNSDEEIYEYKLLPLTFPDSVLQQADGKVGTYTYQLTNPDNGILRKLKAVIPATDASEVLLNDWLKLKGTSDTTASQQSLSKTGNPITSEMSQPCDDQNIEIGWCRTVWPDGHVHFYECEIATVCAGSGGGGGSGNPWPDDGGGDWGDDGGGTGSGGPSGGGPCSDDDPSCGDPIHGCAGNNYLPPDQALTDDYTAIADTTNIDCNSSSLTATEIAWCASTVPKGTNLITINNALNKIKQRGSECAEIAQKGQQLLNQFGIRYYPSGTIPYGGRGGPQFGILLSDAWFADYYINGFKEIIDIDGIKVKINLEYALVHEIEHALGRHHISDSSWRTPHAVSCSGL